MCVGGGGGGGEGNKLLVIYGGGGGGKISGEIRGIVPYILMSKCDLDLQPT